MGSELSRLVEPDDFSKPPELHISPAAMTDRGVRRSPRALTLELSGSAPSLPRIDVSLQLHDATNRVDLVVDLEKKTVLAKQSVYVAFPFAVDAPTVWYDRQQGCVNPAVDHLPGACNDWFALQHSVGLAAKDAAIASGAAPMPRCSRLTTWFAVAGPPAAHHAAGRSCRG